MAKKGKVYMLQVSNDIIRNQNGFNFNENEFALVCSLKYCFLLIDVMKKIMKWFLIIRC